MSTQEDDSQHTLVPSDDKKPIDGLLIGTMLGLIVLGIPTPYETKSKDLPYWVS